MAESVNRVQEDDEPEQPRQLRLASTASIFSTEHNYCEGQPRKPARKYFVMVVAVLFFVVLSILVNHSQRYYLPAMDKHVPRVVTSTTTYYSTARLDRSGAVIHDMLLAHAYAYEQGGTYGGACLENIPVYPNQDCVRLLRDLGWLSALPFSCPSSSQKNAVVLPKEIYRAHDGALFTPAWREVFFQQITKHDPAVSNPGVFRIAVHIRRGDVNPCDFPTRYLPNNYYLRLIQQYTPANQTNVQVTIYSEERSYESFTVFTDHNYTLALNTPLAAVWHALMTADVAILSKSSFSYVPAVLNVNTVIYSDFWHQALGAWKRLDATLQQQTDAEVQRLEQEACRVMPPL
jgi:hypothetical protein